MTAGFPSAGPLSQALLVAALFAMTGCTMHAPLTPLPATEGTLMFAKAVGGGEPGPWPDREWWSHYGDRQLASLIEEGLASSPDMEAARARLSAAEARAAGTGTALLPTIDATAGAQRSRFSANGLFPPPIGGSTVWQNKASFDFRWEFDLWGKHRSALSGALLETEAARLDRGIAELTLSTAIARRYVEWQRLEDQLAIGRSLLEQRANLLSLTQKRVDAGLDSNVQLRAAEAAVPDTRADVAALETQATIARVEIAALVGAGPDRGLEFAKPALSLPAFSASPTLIPADLLARRPDVVARRLRVAAAAARADAAQADFYPNINLAASLGVDSTTFEHWVDGGSRFYNSGPAISLPIWGGGRRRATLDQRTAEYDEAAAMYRQTLLGAARDVATALLDLRSIDAEERDALAAVAAQTQSYELAERRYAGGLGTSSEVLIAEANLLNQRRRIADLNARRLDASVRLVAALGGGIPVEAATAAVRP